MKKVTISVAFVLLISIVAAYFYFSGKEFIVRISEETIKAKMAEKMPLSKTYLFVFQVTLDNPRVDLTNGSERINAGMDVVLNIKLTKEKKPFGGSVDISGGIRYLPEEGQFYLTDPKIEDLSIQGVPEKYSAKARKVLEKALSEYYQQHPIYQLKSKDIKQAAAKLVLKKVMVENEELVVFLGI